MNRISTIALLAIASLATCAGAFGQDRALKANIPFDFTVGNTWMPAGEYIISSPFGGQVLELRNPHKSAFVTVIGSMSYDESNSGSKLVFDTYGDSYFLRHVLCPTVASLNLDVPQGKAEKRARARSLEAKLHNGETLVAAK
jgi:hypothetical protein